MAGRRLEERDTASELAVCRLSVIPVCQAMMRFPASYRLSLGVRLQYRKRVTLKEGLVGRRDGSGTGSLRWRWVRTAGTAPDPRGR